ncbi:hypothetical protein [Pseudomonas fluorescens]|uniref:Lipoprotein n=1 Tax=Pseudomonas fluorescens TaxID=294 RepID=A0A5E7ERE7_PSEFL|nr:hypothetical protein [Pseudomonas fluorescens]VVO29435.1 hypothetical protein PS691_04820 [Pseudomonas fluorescens]
MRIFLGALGLMLLAGCMTPAMNEARSKSPYKTLSSNKPDKIVAQCTQAAWQEEAVFGEDAGAFLQPGKPAGYTVYTTAAEYFVDVQSTDSGTVAKYYVESDTWVAKRRLAALATCL